MKMNIFTFWSFVSVSFILFSFNNCSRMESDLVTNSTSFGSTSPTPNPTPTPTPKTGAELYNTNCAACHQPLTSSYIKGVTNTQINSAISNGPSMKGIAFLKSLSQPDIQFIADALAVVVTPPPTPTPTPTVDKVAQTAQVVNRFILASRLKNLFLPKGTMTTEDNSIATVINNLIGENVEYWGGSCSRYDANCIPTSCGPGENATCASLVNSKAVANSYPQITSASQAFLIRTCEEALEVGTQSRGAVNLLGRLAIDTTIPITASNMKAVMTYAYRDRPVTDTAVNAMMALSTEAQSKNLSVIDQWRFTLLPICASSAMIQL